MLQIFIRLVVFIIAWSEGQSKKATASSLVFAGIAFVPTNSGQMLWHKQIKHMVALIFLLKVLIKIWENEKLESV